MGSDKNITEVILYQKLIISLNLQNIEHSMEN